MLNKEQQSWIHSALGFNVGAAMDAVGKVVKSLPGSPMLADCKPVKGKVPGPPEHLLCATHGHVLDIKEKKIIAASLEQYKSQHPAGAKPGHAAHPDAKEPPAQPAPTAAAPAAATPPALAAPPASSAETDAAKARVESVKLIKIMKLQSEDIEFIRGEYDKLAGGSRFNRALSWISDKAGGADDPGEELNGISATISMEQVLGVNAAMKLDLDAARKHLATMKGLTDKARHLFMVYSGDTSEGAGRVVTGLEVASKAGDVATMGLNVVAPGAGKILSVAKNVSVTTSKIVFGEKVNWAEFGIDMAFDLFVGREGGNMNKAFKKVSGPLAKKLAPKLTEALAKKWGLEALAKKLGSEVTEAAIERYIETEAEEYMKDHVKEMVKDVAEAAKGKEVTNEELVKQMNESLMNPSGPLAHRVAEQTMAKMKP